MTDYNYAVADYIDFQIHVKQAGKNDRDFVNKINLITTKYQRKEKMAEKGMLSNEAVKKLSDNKMQDLADAYAKHIVVGWEGVFRGDKLGKYDAEKCAKILSNPDNDELFADIISFSADVGNFTKEVEEAEVKN